MKKLIFILAISVFALKLSAQGNKTILHFVRPDNFAGKFTDIKIVLNGTEIGTIGNKSHFAYHAKAGNAKITLKGFGSPPKSISVLLEQNRKYYFLVGYNAMGKFIRQVNLSEVKNSIPDSDEPAVEKPKNVIAQKDEKAPVITITNPKVTRGFKTSSVETEIKIEGKAIDESGIFKLTVNGNSTPVDENGNFQSMLALIPGLNEIKVIAIDTQENTSEFTFSIETKSKPAVSGEIIKPSEKRYALIIGNADYKSAPLRNPVNDATLMTEELKKLDFTVNTVKNGSQNQMKEAISKFGELLAKDKNTVGLFYYAGHGLQVKGKNYLVPTDAKIDKEPDVEVYCVDLDALLANLEYAGNNMNIIILDACRNNPFGRGFRSQAGNGLATVNAPVGTIIAFATSPGSVAADGDGKNGLYTQELAKMISVPDLKIEDVFKKVRTQVKIQSEEKQIPWENSSIEGDFYFIRQK